jgi:hypothetical protein
LLEPPALPNAIAPGKPGTPIAGFPIPLKLDKKTLMIGGGALGGLLVLAIGAFLFRRKQRKNRVPPAPTTPATLPSSGAANSSTALAAAVSVHHQPRAAESNTGAEFSR